jgi:hypothetical protein
LCIHLQVLHLTRLITAVLLTQGKKQGWMIDLTGEMEREALVT